MRFRMILNRSADAFAPKATHHEPRVKIHSFHAVNGRGDWIRTNDLRFPKPSRCQTAPRPDSIKILLNGLPRKAKRPIAGRMTDDEFDFRHRFQAAMLFRH